jgi:hypothetical protein
MWSDSERDLTLAAINPTKARTSFGFDGCHVKPRRSPIRARTFHVSLIPSPAFQIASRRSCCSCAVRLTIRAPRMLEAYTQSGPRPVSAVIQKARITDFALCALSPRVSSRWEGKRVEIASPRCAGLPVVQGRRKGPYLSFLDHSLSFMQLPWRPLVMEPIADVGVNLTRIVPVETRRRSGCCRVPPDGWPHSGRSAMRRIAHRNPCQGKDRT